MTIVIFPIMCHVPRGDEKNSLLSREDTLKGFFPHEFNFEENQDYVGELPAKEFFTPELSFSEENLQGFTKWHSETARL